MNRQAVRMACEVEPFQEFKENESRSELDQRGPAVSQERRTLLGILTGLIGVGITSLLGITLGRFSIVPALAATSASDWIDAGRLDAVPNGKPKKQTVLVAQNAGWGRFTAEQSVWLIRSGEEVKVFSSVCPHLGCTITENPNGFGCVCHNSAWTRDGTTSAGPAPRGMDQLEHKVEDGILKVKYQTFKQGLPEKVVTS
ncbi:MAG TPA: Rieske (2Fe-2S) protein [Pyrinomonadaceae bacterium]|nr:Rieske (2Fe-2S) protein [Pyrinomonadaceae bacterium]